LLGFKICQIWGFGDSYRKTVFNLIAGPKGQNALTLMQASQNLVLIFSVPRRKQKKITAGRFPFWLQRSEAAAAWSLTANAV